jgi:hypothetical protein
MDLGSKMLRDLEVGSKLAGLARARVAIASRYAVWKRRYQRC